MVSPTPGGEKSGLGLSQDHAPIALERTPQVAPSHTPGPWAHGLDDVDAIWAVNTPEDGGNVICEPPPAACTASLARWIANARLIAAAPDMLAALLAAEDKAQRGTLNMTAEECERVNTLRRAAIAKATRAS